VEGIRVEKDPEGKEICLEVGRGGVYFKRWYVV